MRIGGGEVSVHDAGEIDGRSGPDACPVGLRQRDRVYVVLGRTRLSADREAPCVALGRRCPPCRRSRGKPAFLGDHGVQRRHGAVIFERSEGMAAGRRACSSILNGLRASATI